MEERGCNLEGLEVRDGVVQEVVKQAVEEWKNRRT